ncbi:MAG TPA: hypothetical protein VHF23_08570 [Gaiellaceae bacterium]|nr:hypothetical protein [Gaiellaceae bacterium]
MELEIVPEPPPDGREAVERALARLLAEGEDPRSAWWRAGVRENLMQAEGESV